MAYILDIFLMLHVVNVCVYYYIPFYQLIYFSGVSERRGFNLQYKQLYVSSFYNQFLGLFKSRCSQYILLKVNI